MPSLRSRLFAVASLVGFTVLGSGSSTRADVKQACLGSYDKAQTQRQAGKLVEAREELLVCARNVCPDILRNDCTQWLSEVEASTPTVVLSVSDSKGRDLVDVTVTVDGEPLVTQIDGRAIDVNPGVHTFRFEVEGEEPVEERIVIHAAAKNRSINIRFGVNTTQPEGQPARGKKGEGTKAGPPTTAYIFGGVGLVGLAAFAYFGKSFESKLDDLEACKPNCLQSDADDASSTRNLALLSAGVSVVSLGVAAYLFFSAPTDKEAATEESKAPRVDLLPVRGGAVGTFGARF